MHTIPIARIKQGRQIADSCVHFGFCTAVCPTYVLDGNENDSPRGRIALIKSMLEQGGKPDPDTIVHVDRCLSCLSCATTCAAGVDYRPLIDTAREYIEKSGARPLRDSLTRKTLAYLMTNPGLLKSLLKVGKPFTGVAARMPGALGALGRLSDAPGVRALAKRSSFSSEREAARLTAPVRKIALLDGCAQSVIGKEINDAARRLFNRLNVQVVESNTANECCGALNLHLGYEQKAARQARVLMDDWCAKLDRQEIDAIVVTTSGCGSVIRHYRDLFLDDPVQLERARQVEEACLDITQFLMQLTLPAVDLSSSTHRGARVAYHDSCSLKHGQKITMEPRHILDKVGFTVKDIAENHLCCGSAGTYNILQPDIAQRLGERKAGNIEATQPDIIAAGNMGCLMQISLYTPIPIAHVVQLVDWALGGPAPRGLESFQPATLSPVQSANADIWGNEASVTTETDDSLW